MTNNFLTQQFLQEIGITIDEQAFATLREHFGTTLEDRVINEVIDSLSNEQAEELATMKEASSEQLQSWIHSNVPELADIIQDEVDILLGELSENADAV